MIPEPIDSLEHIMEHMLFIRNNLKNMQTSFEQLEMR